VKCIECGAELPGKETCLDRFGALLAAERDAEGNLTEAFKVHGLTVMTFYLQHAGGSGYTKRWMLDSAEQAMLQIFREGRDHAEVLPPDRRVARQKAATAAKAMPGAHDPITSIVGPLPGELTIATLDPANLSDHIERVIAWAQSVAEHRVLNRA
jgi:hypothetical protein